MQTGMPERPKGMTSAERKLWDGYVEQLGPMGVLRAVDGFALRRLCEDVALLEELKRGKRKLAQALAKKAKEEGRQLAAGPMLEFTTSEEGRSLDRTINSLDMRIRRSELQFGLTPVSSQRLENIVLPAFVPQAAAGMDAVEAALCG